MVYGSGWGDTKRGKIGDRYAHGRPLPKPAPLLSADPECHRFVHSFASKCSPRLPWRAPFLMAAFEYLLGVAAYFLGNFFERLCLHAPPVLDRGADPTSCISNEIG